jgi:ketose-bisphosphate aldolase
LSLQKLSKLLKTAQESKYAVGYFEAWDLYSFEAVLEAAEEENAPVVLGFGGTMMEQNWLQRFGIVPLGAYGRVMAENAKVPAAFILNEVLDLKHIELGTTVGFNTVMLDSCHLPFEENVAITQKVVALAKPHNIEVQAEFGRLPNHGETLQGVLTDPEKAADFVKQTKVDFLAVSIGNVHLQTSGESAIDIERLKKIREAVDVPLVIHGGTGFPREKVEAAIQCGVSLFHFGTLMKKAFFEATKTTLDSINWGKVNYQAIVGSRKETDILHLAKQEIKKIVKKYMNIYGCSGRAQNQYE